MCYVKPSPESYAVGAWRGNGHRKLWENNRDRIGQAHSSPHVLLPISLVQESINKTFTFCSECVDLLKAMETETPVPYKTLVYICVFMCMYLCICFSNNKMKNIYSFYEYIKTHSILWNYFLKTWVQEMLEFLLSIFTWVFPHSPTSYSTPAIHYEGSIMSAFGTEEIKAGFK